MSRPTHSMLLSTALAAVTMLGATQAAAQSSGKHNGSRHCYDVQVQRPKQIKDQNKVAGTAIGAVAGGLLGNQVGGGNGRKLATVAGAVGGGLVGRKVQGNQQQKMETVTERRCD